MLLHVLQSIQIYIIWSFVQAGALDPVEVADARMEYDLECSGYNVRQFLGTISGQGTLGEFGHSVMQDILALVTEVEQETDAVLDADNEEGWEMFQERVAVSLDHLRAIVVCAIPGLHTVRSQKHCLSYESKAAIAAPDYIYTHASIACSAKLDCCCLKLDDVTISTVTWIMCRTLVKSTAWRTLKKSRRKAS